MATYFKNIKSFEDLKRQFRELLKANHPDNGGNEEVMKEINVEFDALFPIWKNRTEKETGETIDETASGYRRKFYTQNGWEGSRYDSNLSLKEIAKIVRTYVKEKYPTCKFSVRTAYASMCQELHVEIKEFPSQMYKTGDDLRKEGLYETVHTTLYTTGEPYTYERYKAEIDEMERKLRRNRLFELDSWTNEDLIQAYEKAVEKNPFYGIKTEYFKSVLEDVDSFVQSYNYDDSDGMIDYFDNNFYYFNCKFDNCKYVPKTARIKKQESGVQKRAQKEQTKQTTEETPKIGRRYTYKITKGEDTRDGSELWIVKILESLDKAAYIAENKAMKERGGYYSKFKKGFLFRNDPTEILKVEGVIA